MIDQGKKNILGVNISAIDYDSAVDKIISAAKESRKLSVTALAVHGVMTGALDPVQASRLNSFNLVVPDGHPVRWALNLLYKCALADRCYGPTLTLRICQRAAQERVPIFLYGSKPRVVEALSMNLKSMFPDLIVSGIQPSLFRKTTIEEKEEIVYSIKQSGAKITFVGLGCPRQEVWVYEYQNYLNMPVIAVGAAFDFHAGLMAQAPPFFQDRGLEWLFRFLCEPKRLWRRYILLNPLYLSLIALQLLKLKSFKHINLNVSENKEMFG